MRILYLMDQMYLHGGAERILCQKINYLINHSGQEVHLITSEQQDRKPVYDLDSALLWNDLGINYQRDKSFFHPQNLFRTAKHFLRLRKVLKEINPDVIISVSISPEQYFLPFIHTNIPKIKEFHSSRFRFSPSGSKAKLERSLSRYDALVVLNEDERAFYNNKNIIVIPNFTDFETSEFDSVYKEEIVIAAGRIAPVKQFDELIRIWKPLAGKFPSWKLHIFGDGSPRIIDDLNALVQKLGLDKNVEIHASVSDLASQFAKASIYAMTSETECFPMVLLEAQSKGLAIVSYDCPTGPRHIVRNDRNGFLIENNNKQQFEEKLSLLMKDGQLRQEFAQNAIADAHHFTKEKVMAMWEKLFIELKTRN